MDVGQEYLGQAGQAFAPLSALGQKYGAGTTMLQNALGLNGPAGNQAAVNAFQTGPGYEFALDQGLKGMARQRAAGVLPGGGITSGASDADALKYAMGLGNQEYGNWQKNLSQFINPELLATGSAATGQAGALGQQATLAQQGNTNMANLWLNDATNRVNLNNMTTQGLTQNATQGANSQMAASNNFLNLVGGGLQALTGAAGKAGGFGNLFG